MAGGGILLNLLSYPIFLHYIGTELYGLWSILTVVIAFSTLGNLGIDDALIKYIAEEFDKKNIEDIKFYISAGMNILFVNGFVFFIIFLGFEKFFQKVLNLKLLYLGTFHRLFLPIVLLSIFSFFVNYINSILKGIGRFDQANYIILISRFIALIVSLSFFLEKFRIWGLYWGQLFSSFFIFIASGVLIYKKIGLFYYPQKNRRPYYIKLIKFGGTMTLAKIVSMFLEPFIKIVIARFVGLVEVTYFEIANKIILQIRSVFERAINAIMPEVSRLSVSVKGMNSNLNRVMQKINKLNIIAVFGIFGILLIFSAPALKLWLAHEYSGRILDAFRILIIGYSVNILCIPMYYYFMGIGKIRYCLINHLTQVALNLFIITFFIYMKIPHFSFIIISYSASLTISALLLIFLYKLQNPTWIHENI